MTSSKYARIGLLGILFLFFFQLISDFVAALYAVALLGQGVPIEILYLFLLLSPLLLPLVRRRAKGLAPAVVGGLVLACRVVEPLLGTDARMIVAGLGTGCFMLLLPDLITGRDGQRREAGGVALGTGLTGALSLSILFRALNSGTDISTEGMFQVIGWVLAIAAALLYRYARRQDSPATEAEEGRTGAAQDPPGFWRTAGLALGVIGGLTLLYFAFTSPGVMVRWTGSNYLSVIVVIAAVLASFAILSAYAGRCIGALNRWVVLAWNLLFVLSLVIAIVVHQVGFPTDPGVYPLAEPGPRAIYALPFVLALLLFPVIVVDFVLLSQELADRRPSARRLGGAFALAGFFLLFVILAHIFTTTYAYVPLVGPLFRDRFWLVYLIVSAAMALPVLLVRRTSFWPDWLSGRMRLGSIYPGAVLVLGVLAIAGAALTAARPAAPEGAPTTLRIVTYNILQGYDEEGQENVDGQLALLRRIDADIIGLQECDTNRIAGANTDIVRHFADRLDMHAYYGPKPVVGTFGIALLSRYPIENPRTFYMYSYEPGKGGLVDLEQTAGIEAQIPVGDRTFSVFVTHLGNGGPMVQQEAVLREVAGRQNVILMGDFNFEPDSDQYRLTTETYDDAWVVRWPDIDKKDADPLATAIDHIFVSRGTDVVDAQFLPDPESDHPATTADIEW